MPKLLVADHQRYIRKALKDTLVDCGYEVIDAANGQAVLEIALQEKIDGILLDVELPVIDGWQVLARLKEEPKTKSIPVMMLISFPSVETEATGIRLGAAHFISKPWHPEALAITVRVALREAQETPEKEHPVPTSQQGAPLIRKPPSESKKFIDTGSKLIPFERLLGGGIPLDMLTLIEGDSGAAKSILCHYLAFGAILDGHSVAYFTSKYTAASLFEQMGTIGLDVSEYLHGDSVTIHPLGKPSVSEDPETLLTALASDIERIPPNRGIIIVDSITRLAEISEDRATLRFFSSCQVGLPHGDSVTIHPLGKPSVSEDPETLLTALASDIERLSNEGRTILLVASSSAFDQSMHSRIHGMCDTHIRLGTEQIRDKVLSTLAVLKANKAELHSDNGFSFEVKPGTGITIVPMSRVKV